SEEIRERCLSFIGLESIFLVDSNPGQLLPTPRQLIALPCKILLGLEQLPPGRQPLSCRAVAVRRLVACSNLMLSHASICSLPRHLSLMPVRLGLTYRCLIGAI